MAKVTEKRSLVLMDGFSSYRTVAFLSQKSADSTLKVFQTYLTERHDTWLDVFSVIASYLTGLLHLLWFLLLPFIDDCKDKRMNC